MASSTETARIELPGYYLVGKGLSDLDLGHETVEALRGGPVANPSLVAATRGSERYPYPSIVQFTAAVTHEAPWYVARCLEVEVTSQGETSEDALRSLKEALELYFEDIPLPKGLEAPIIATVEIAV